VTDQRAHCLDDQLHRDVSDTGEPLAHERRIGQRVDDVETAGEVIELEWHEVERVAVVGERVEAGMPVAIA
jgi:hypothetical protein